MWSANQLAFTSQVLSHSLRSTAVCLALLQSTQRSRAQPVALPAFVLMLWFGPRCLGPHSSPLREVRHCCHPGKSEETGVDRVRTSTWQCVCACVAGRWVVPLCHYQSVRSLLWSALYLATLVTASEWVQPQPLHILPWHIYEFTPHPYCCSSVTRLLLQTLNHLHNDTLNIKLVYFLTKKLWLFLLQYHSPNQIVYLLGSITDYFSNYG